MSQEVLTYGLAELEKVRIVCKGQRHGKPCSGVLEVALTDLMGLYQRLPACPLCGSPFGVFPADSGGRAQDGFTPLVQAIALLKAVANRFELELVLPRPE